MEIWKDAIGYEGMYEVSSCGRVRNKKRARIMATRITRNKYGYVGVCLWINGKKKNDYVHRMVALAFHENPDNKSEVNHKDNIKTNNNSDNLEWMTKSENIVHSHGFGRNYLWQYKGKVEQYNLSNNETIKIWNSAKDICESGYKHIYKVLSEKCKLKSCNGYGWRYVR